MGLWAFLIGAAGGAIWDGSWSILPKADEKYIVLGELATFMQGVSPWDEVECRATSKGAVSC